MTVTIWELANPQRYGEGRGRVVEAVRGTEARAHIDKLSRKHTGRDYDGARIQSERVLLRIAPDFQHLREPPS